MNWNPLLRLNRSRTCRLCMKRGQRVLILSPKPDDENYTVAVCPDCDMTCGRVEREI